MNDLTLKISAAVIRFNEVVEELERVGLNRTALAYQSYCNSAVGYDTDDMDIVSSLDRTAQEGRRLVEELEDNG